MKDTFLYLVYFIEEDAYKVGITTTTISRRFTGYPALTVVDKLELSSSEAKKLRKIILDQVDEYTPESLKFKSGNTKCFKSETEIESLDYFLEEKPWTKEEDEYLIKNYEKDNLALERTPDSIDRRCGRLNLVKMPRWSKRDESELIRLSNEGQSLARMSIRLNRSEEVIKKKISSLLKGLNDG